MDPEFVREEVARGRVRSSTAQESTGEQQTKGMLYACMHRRMLCACVSLSAFLKIEATIFMISSSLDIPMGGPNPALLRTFPEPLTAPALPSLNPDTIEAIIPANRNHPEP